jgi:lantibiotic modifying enzyme
MSWQPLLRGELKDRARESVQAIVDALAPLGREPTGEPSLAGGTAGLALLHAYLAQTEGASDHAAIANRYLQQATAAVAEKPTEAFLYSGLAGVGWAIGHLQGRLPGLDGEADAVEIDDVLLHHLDSSPWPDDYDLICGLVGFGVYALERLPRPSAVACLERVIDRLAETAEHRDEGITWWTNPKWLAAETREKSPRGYYNLGLAHGVPGVIALLGQACAVGVGQDRARPLLDGAARWLLAQQLPDGFPAWVAPEAPREPTRLAWCYGDPGVAVSLLWTARCVNEPAWEREALSIARRAAQRPADKSGVVDAGLCHGASGLGHIFNRLFQATGEERFADAARFWFERTLALRQPERGIAGYAAWMPSLPGNKDGWIDDPGILTGAAGIALALLAATTTVEPEWDRILLVSVPPTD